MCHEKIAEMIRKRTVEVIAQQLGYLPALHLGGTTGTTLTHRPPL